MSRAVGMLLAAFFCLATPVVAQNAAIITRPENAPLEPLAALRGDYFHIRSANVGRGFHIYVRYPEGYDPASERLYPTVYLTDGDSLFPMLAPAHLFLHYDEALPEALVVGIAYGGFDRETNLRHIDFQPPDESLAPEAAGAEAFQRFLKVELIPEIEARYRADPGRRVLFGQSRGGTFVLYSAVTDPDLFWGRIASNPSMTPGMDFLLRPAAPASLGDLGLIVTSGTRDRPRLQEEAAHWLSVWEGREDRPWRLNGLRIEGGTHAANAPDAYRRGMLALFETTSSP